MRTFWTVGYDDASISVLADAMGIRSASLYAAFGDKAGLFAEAVALYGERHGGYVRAALALEPTRNSMERLLLDAVDRFTDPALPAGCLVALSSSRCSETTSRAGLLLHEQRSRFRHAIQARLEQGRRAGDLLSEDDTGQLADYILLVFEGLSAAARQGIVREQLNLKVNWALGFWPLPASSTADSNQRVSVSKTT